MSYDDTQDANLKAEFDDADAARLAALGRKDVLVVCVVQHVQQAFIVLTYCSEIGVSGQS